MGLRERILYGKDQQFGNWFHQHCIWVRNNAKMASKNFQHKGLAKIIHENGAIEINETIINYISAVFILYLIFTIAEDKGEDYLMKRLTPIASIIHTVFGPSTVSLYEAAMNDISARRVAPESSIAHLLIDPLELPLAFESQALEATFDFLSESVEEYYLPTLEETYSHNPSIPHSVFRSFGH